MNQIIPDNKHNGKIATSESVHEIDAKTGKFVRQKNRFTTPFGDQPGELPVEANRYRLLWTPLCPWAHRQKIAFALLGLDDVISTGTAHPRRTDKGWSFANNPGGVDPVLKIHYLPEIYAKTDPDYTGRATVPCVVDVKEGKVVNNDYFNLTYYWETAWKPFHKKGAPDLFPEDLREDIKALNDVIFNDVNNGVYKAGFAESQEAYEDAFDHLFARLDELEERLSHSRYLFGDRLTDSDIRLYVTLARFDIAYYPVFLCNQRRLIDYPNLWNYAKDLYSIPAFKNTTNSEAIKYYHENEFGILPKGPDLSLWDEPNDRAEKFGGK